jgi:DNA-directed RNA polymerase subunit RPC12/RpoP
VLLELSDRPVELTARIMRCELAEAPRRDRRRQFALAVAFVNPPAEAQVVLERVCSRAAKALPPPGRRLGVSLIRRCPRCTSRSVHKEARRRYRCSDCRHEFTGIRIGFLRFAR